MRAALAGVVLALLAARLPAAAQTALPPDAQPGAQPGSPTAPAPTWLADAVGRFAGMVRNNGRMECHRTVFALQDGRLVGHYWIEAADPFEGELTGFAPTQAAGGGVFTWTDRYGVGVEFVQFADDYASFRGAWGGAAPDWGNPVSGVRGGVSGCDPAVS